MRTVATNGPAWGLGACRYEEPRREGGRGFEDRREFRSYRDPHAAESRDSRDVPARTSKW